MSFIDLSIQDHARSFEREVVDKQITDNESSFYTAHNGYEWTATEDGYDGAPDSVGRYSIHGSGKTEAEAIENLKEQIADLEDE